jgi:hypothetical protein
MSPFTPRSGDAGAEQEEVLAWLRETLDRLAPDRGMPAGSTWQIVPGVRERGGSSGPRLHQPGFQIGAIDAAGRPWRLTCFVNGEDAMEAELRPTVEQVLALWLDRLSVTPPE